MGSGLVSQIGWIGFGSGDPSQIFKNFPIILDRPIKTWIGSGLTLSDSDSDLDILIYVPTSLGYNPLPWLSGLMLEKTPLYTSPSKELLHTNNPLKTLSRPPFPSLCSFFFGKLDLSFPTPCLMAPL